MRTMNEMIQFCETLEDVYQDTPFGVGKIAYKHGSNDRMFILIYERLGNIWVNLKVEPQLSGLLRRSHKSITYGYHMNKDHWISVILDGSVELELIMQIIRESYSLTKRRVYAKKRKRS